MPTMWAPSGATVLEPGLTLGLTIAIPALRWVLHTYCFQPLCWSILQQKDKRGSKAAGSKQQLHVTVEKACESLWKLVVYTAFLALSCQAILRQPWAYDTSQLWQDWPNHDLSPSMQWLYNLELSFYISSVFMIVLWEIRRRDFAAMFAHHLVTVVLIAASMHLRFWRAGCLIMALHDFNDVFMEAAKLAKYAGQEVASTAMFATFMVSWAVTRLGIFPWVVVASTVRDSWALVGAEYPLPAYVLFNGLLLVLCVLHCYWFTLILKVAYNSVTTGATSDVREDDD